MFRDIIGLIRNLSSKPNITEEDCVNLEEGLSKYVDDSNSFGKVDMIPTYKVNLSSRYKDYLRLKTEHYLSGNLYLNLGLKLSFTAKENVNSDIFFINSIIGDQMEIVLRGDQLTTSWYNYDSGEGDILKVYESVETIPLGKHEVYLNIDNRVLTLTGSITYSQEINTGSVTTQTPAFIGYNPRNEYYFDGSIEEFLLISKSPFSKSNFIFDLNNPNFSKNCFTNTLRNAELFIETSHHDPDNYIKNEVVENTGTKSDSRKVNLSNIFSDHLELYSADNLLRGDQPGDWDNYYLGRDGYIEIKFSVINEFTDRYILSGDTSNIKVDINSVDMTDDNGDTVSWDYTEVLSFKNILQTMEPVVFRFYRYHNGDVEVFMNGVSLGIGVFPTRSTIGFNKAGILGVNSSSIEFHYMDFSGDFFDFNEPNGLIYHGSLGGIAIKKTSHPKELEYANKVMTSRVNTPLITREFFEIGQTFGANYFISNETRFDLLYDWTLQGYNGYGAENSTWYVDNTENYSGSNGIIGGFKTSDGSKFYIQGLSMYISEDGSNPPTTGSFKVYWFKGGVEVDSKTYTLESGVDPSSNGYFLIDLAADEKYKVEADEIRFEALGLINYLSMDNFEWVKSI